jgi:predicted DNA binding CopG/RHH family protein
MARGHASQARELPAFKDEAEAAAFWDTHSPLDYPEQFQEVQVTFSRPLVKRGLTIKLTEDSIERLRRLASEKGIGPSTLARMWILERLREHEEPPRRPKTP